MPKLLASDFREHGLEIVPSLSRQLWQRAQSLRELTMTLWQKLAIAAGALLVLGLVGASYIGHVRADAEMRATLTQQQEIFAKQSKVIEAQTEAIAAISERMERREAETARTLADLSRQQARIAQQTPAQNIQQLPQVVPIAPQPTSNGGAILSQEDVRKLLDFSLECKKCQVELAAKQAAVADLQTVIEAKDVTLAAKDEQIAAVEKQRDSAVKAAKGGGFWKRLRSKSTWVGIGAAAGVVLAKVLGD